MVYVIETWWVSLYIITAHLKHTNSTINQCPSWSLCSICSICRTTNKEPQGYEAYSVVYAIETWWVSLYIITAHLKHTNSTINQCPSWSLCSICRTTNKEPQGYEAYSVVYVIETWWVSLNIIIAHLKHTNSTINQCPSWSLCSICRTTNKEPQGNEEYSVVYVIETWWVSLYIITAHLKHTNSIINQCLSWSLCSICRITNEEPQGYEAYSVVYVIETWWVSLYIITAHLKHTNSTINQCPRWSLCSICRTTNKEPQGYEAYSVVYAIETWWVSLYIITAHLKHTNSTINQCPSWSLCSICRTTNKELQGYEAYSVVYVIETWWVSHYHCTFKHTKESKVCRVLSHEFGVVRLYRTFSNHIITELQRCVEFFHMSSGWFDCTEPSVTTSLQWKQGVQGVYGLVQGGSSASNLLEPSRTTSSQRKQGV